MTFKYRVLAKMAAFGEQFSVNGNTYRGFFRILDSGTLRCYLDDTESMGVVKPGLVLFTEPDAQIAQYDEITRDGRIYSVWKTSLHRIEDTPVLKIVILS